MGQSQKEILKSLLPAILFMVVFKFYSYKVALGVGFVFGAAIYISEYRKHNKLSSMDKLGLFGLVVQSVLGALASNPKVYFVYPLIENIVFAIIFIGSLFSRNTIISLFAKDYASDNDAYEIMCQHRVKKFIKQRLKSPFFTAQNLQVMNRIQLSFSL